VAKKKEMLCVDCLNRGIPKDYIKGHFMIELILWLFFIVPGLIYTVWRLSSRKNVCQLCGGANLIPVDSPRARQLLAA